MATNFITTDQLDTITTVANGDQTFILEGVTLGHTSDTLILNAGTAATLVSNQGSTLSGDTPIAMISDTATFVNHGTIISLGTSTSSEIFEIRGGNSTGPTGT